MTKPTLKTRILITLTATVVAGICGSFSGYLLGRITILKLTESRLDQDVTRVSKEADRYLAESRAVLVAMNASPYQACGDQELVYFRALLFESKRLKDVGRIQSGNIDCSAALGHLTQTRTMPKADFLLQDGTTIYKNLPLYQDDDETVITLQLEDSYVVFRPENLVQLGPGLLHFTENVQDVPTRRTGLLRGDSLQVPSSILTSDGDTRLDNMLYATRCSTRGQSCVTGYLSISEALREERVQLGIYMFVGGLTCAFLGFFVSVIYRRSRGMEQQLRRALRGDKLRVVYQPVVDLTTRRIVGAEALVRWTDEDDFAISPEVFVKIAEERGFIGEITKFILRRTLREFGPTLRNSSSFRLNINVTATDLADRMFLPLLARSLEEAEVPTQRLGIEITESGTARQQVAMDTILQLRRRGHRVYIDDFGTGYSSLAYLHDLAIDAIKIDRAFTKSIGTEAVTMAVLPQILAMAESLNLQVVVEGIETTEQARYFTGDDKHYLAQGWLFGHPLSASDFQALLVEDAKNLDASSKATEAPDPISS